MKIGFIGAGKVGYSLAKWFNLKYPNIVKGIYSKSLEDSIDLSKFSISEYYKNINDLIYDCDTLFLTVNDDSISLIVDELIKLNVKNKILIHTSGSYSSLIFKELNNSNCCLSIHPLYAFNDKYESYKNLDDIYFTIEGNLKYINDLKELFNNKIIEIKSKDKEKYHLASSIISNMVCGLVDVAKSLYEEVGIDDMKYYLPLLNNNINNINQYGVYKSLTGPIIRNDYNTIKKHISNLKENDLMIYKYLGLHLVKMSEEITNNDYSKIKELLEEI